MYRYSKQQRFLRLGSSLTTRRRGNCNYLLMVFQSPHPSTTYTQPPRTHRQAAPTPPRSRRRALAVSAPPPLASPRTCRRKAPCPAKSQGGCRKTWLGKKKYFKTKPKTEDWEEGRKLFPQVPPQPREAETARRHQPGTRRASQRRRSFLCPEPSLRNFHGLFQGRDQAVGRPQHTDVLPHEQSARRCRNTWVMAKLH